jgi:uncharacterized lipoprotein YbaY
MAGTLMAVNPNVPKVARFITLGGDPYLIRYNSHLPIVVYVPKEVEVRYRIWTAGDEVRFPTEDGRIVIKGALSYLARIALPPEARAIVDIREGSTSAGAVVAEHRRDLGGKQVPLPFEFVVSRASLIPGKSYSLRGAVFVEGRPTWVSNSAAIDPAAGSIDVGTLSMLPAPRGAFNSILTCGDERVTVGFSQAAVLLNVGGETFEMRQSKSASGARYEAVNDPTTILWNKGDRTTVSVRGRILHECSTSGNEPGLSRAGGRAVLEP